MLCKVSGGENRYFGEAIYLSLFLEEKYAFFWEKVLKFE
jgi:hypothetical protein